MAFVAFIVYDSPGQQAGGQYGMGHDGIGHDGRGCLVLMQAFADDIEPARWES